MKFWRTLLALIPLWMATAHGSVTAAWKGAIEEVAPDLRTNPKFSRLERAPGPSSFIQPGDELWDISKVLRWVDEPDDSASQKPPTERTDWQGDWIVWNARSKMIVASGSWADLYAINDILRSKHGLRHLRCTFELVDGRESGLPRAVTLAASGCEATAEEGELKAKCTSHENAGINSFQTTVSWQQPGSEHTWEVDTQASSQTEQEP